MLRDLRVAENYYAKDATMRLYSAFALCALLLVFCVNTKQLRPELSKHTINQSSARTFLDSNESRRKLPKVATYLLIFVGGLAPSFFIRMRATQLPAIAARVTAFSGFDPECHVRPPPVR